MTRRHFRLIVLTCGISLLTAVIACYFLTPAIGVLLGVVTFAALERKYHVLFPRTEGRRLRPWRILRVAARATISLSVLVCVTTQAVIAVLARCAPVVTKLRMPMRERWTRR